LVDPLRRDRDRDRRMMTSARPYGLVLAGGGLKGLLHCPVLYGMSLAPAPNPLHGKLGCVVGSSVGTVCGYLLAIGLRPLEIFARSLARNLPANILSTVSYVNLLGGRGLLDWEVVESFLTQCAEETLGPGGGDLTLAGLYGRTGVDLVCVITNLARARPEYWSYRTHPDVRALEAVRISCGHPLLLLPVMRDGAWLGDGGILDNLGMTFAVQYRPDLDFVALTAQRECPHDIMAPSAERVWTVAMLLEYMRWFHSILTEKICAPESGLSAQAQARAHYFVAHPTGEIAPRPAEAVGGSGGDRELELSAMCGIHILPARARAGRTHWLVRFPSQGVGTGPGEHEWFRVFHQVAEWSRRAYTACQLVPGQSPKLKSD